MAKISKQNFIEWLQDKNLKKLQPSACVECLESVSDYAKSHGISKKSFWEITDYKKFNAIRTTISANRVYRFFHRNIVKNFDTAGKLYSDYLKDCFAQVAAEQATPVTEAASTPVSVLNETNGQQIAETIEEPQSEEFVEAPQPQVEYNEQTEISEPEIQQDVVLSAYGDWLVNEKKLNEKTRGSYCSGLRSVDGFLATNGIIPKSIFLYIQDELKPMLDLVFADQKFIDYNRHQHNRLSAALKSYYRFVTGTEYFSATRRIAETSAPVESNAAETQITVESNAAEAPKRQPAWDIYEAAILLDGYLKITNGAERQKIISAVSENLRKMALNQGKTIDDTYRNYDDVNAQSYSIKAAFTGEAYISAPSKLFFATVNLYKNSRKVFDTILNEAFNRCAALSSGQAAPLNTSPQTEQAPKVISQTFEAVQKLPSREDMVEEFILKADIEGTDVYSVSNGLDLTVVSVRAAVQKLNRVVEIKNKLYHEDAFCDWEEGAEKLYVILQKLMQRNNGYASASQLYDYAKTDMHMFLNDNDINDERSVYDLAQHLFEKNGYKGVKYVFSAKKHISGQSGVITNVYDLICKFADDAGGVFSESDLAEYMASVGSGASNLRQKMWLYEKPDFFFCEEDKFIYAKYMNIDDDWFNAVADALKRLFNDLGDHIILSNINSFWYEKLPALPCGQKWNALLLQGVLRFYGERLKARTIPAMSSQDILTLHAMLVSRESPVQSFHDAVISYFYDNNITNLQYDADELRRVLVKNGMIHGNELSGSGVYKALSGDSRFVWNAACDSVIIRVE